MFAHLYCLRKLRSGVFAVVVSVMLGGCSLAEPQYEATEREALHGVGRSLGIAPFAEEAQRAPGDSGSGSAPAVGKSLVLPELSAEATAEDYLRFALLKHPRVRGAFYRWWAQVEAITPARSLPDPVLTFEADIANTLLMLMPGLMLEFPGWGKRTAMGQEAAAAARVAYQEYQSALYQRALQVQEAWAQLHYSDQLLALAEASLALLGQSVAIANAGHRTGAGSLQEQADELNAHGRATVLLAELIDQQQAARARFKSALGLHYSEPDPHWPPLAFPVPQGAADEAQLWAALYEHNPRLNALRAMAQLAATQVVLADKEGNPDFALGLMVDVKHSPVLFRPQAAMTLPLWRDKIDAVLASAQAQALAAAEAINEAELALAAELAQVLVVLRQSNRTLAYLSDVSLPNAERALLSADAAYRSGSGEFGVLTRLGTAELEVRAEIAAMERDRALAFAQLAMLSAQALPADGLVPAKSRDN